MDVHSQSESALLSLLQSDHGQQQEWPVEQDNGVVEALLSSDPSDPYLIPTTPAGYDQRSAFATLSRLLSCLVNEGIVDAYYVDHGLLAKKSYIFIVPCGLDPSQWKQCSIVSQMRHKPVVAKSAQRQLHFCISHVRLLDPEDIGAHQWIQHRCFEVAEPVLNPNQIMRLVGKWNSYSSAAVDNICCELASSIENQAYAYKNRPPAPSVAFSTAIEWEQSIVEGHATHPMHRARYAVPPLEHIAPDTDFFHLRLAFIAVPRSEVRIEGNLEELLDPLYGNTDMDSADKQGSQYILDYVDRSVEIVLPVHPLHLPAVQAMFAFARVLPFSVPAEAQASLRTVRPSAFMPLGYNIKLPLGIKVSSSLRTITPWSTYVGPRITKVIPMLLRGMATGEPLLIAGEPASAVSTSPDFDIAKYLSCVIREDPEFICRSRGERVILAAALTTYDDSGTSTIVQQWNLDTQEKRRAFLQAYAEKLFDAFLPPIINHGFAFEAHPQNSLLRIDAETGEIRGFIVRDFGGIKVHRETFKQSSGIYIDMLPNSCTDAQSMYEVYDLAYHTLVQCQLHRLVRALKLHYKGNGWAIVRKAFEQRVPESHSLRSTWYQESFDLKCFVTMKVDGLYRDYIYRKVPNVLFYENEEKGILFPPVDTI